MIKIIKTQLTIKEKNQINKTLKIKTEFKLIKI